MKKSVWCAVFSSIVVLSASSCKTMNDPASDPEYAVSDGGTMLTAVGGKARGICMLESSLHNPKKARLVTDRGAISSEQLKSALRYMGYGEQYCQHHWSCCAWGCRYRYYGRWSSSCWCRGSNHRTSRRYIWVSYCQGQYRG